jgi:MFS family permease
LSRRLFYPLPQRHYTAGDRIRAAALLTVCGVCIGFVIGGIGLQVLGYGTNWVYGVVFATVGVVFIVLWRRTLDLTSGYTTLPPPREPGKIQNAIEALGLLGTIVSILFFIAESAMKLFAYNRWIFFGALLAVLALLIAIFWCRLRRAFGWDGSWR